MKDKDKKLIEKELNDQISTIKGLKKASADNLFGVKKVADYIVDSSASKIFFENLESDDLIEKYEEELVRISESLGNSKFTSKQKLLNFLEYIRLNGMYENIEDKNFNKLQNFYRAAISQSGINIALLGKGVCASQARFLRDLLVTSGEKAKDDMIEFRDEDGFNIDNHTVTYTKISEESKILFVDPTWYNGTVESVKGSLNLAYIPEKIKSKLTSLNVTQEEIEQARNNASEYLVNRLQIKEISKQLGISDVSDMEKQIRMLTFIEKNVAPTIADLKCRSVVIGDREMEVGKLLELFYKANDIPYTLQCNGDKHKSIYTTEIDGQKLSLSPEDAFRKKPNENSLSQKLHFTRNEQGQRQYVCILTEENKQKFKEVIINSRKIAENVVIPKQNLSLNKVESGEQFFEELKGEVEPIGSIPYEDIGNDEEDIEKIVSHEDDTPEVI